MKRPGSPRRRTPLRPSRRRATSVKELRESAAWRQLVLARGPWLRAAGEWPVHEALSMQAHHVVPQQTLRDRARIIGVPAPELLWDGRVGVAVSKRRHERHHSGHEPIRRDELPEQVFDFAEEYGLGWYLDRHYPKEA